MKRWVPTISLVAVLFAGVTVSSVWGDDDRSEEHTSELQSQSNLVCRLLLEKKNLRSPLAARAEPRRQHHRRHWTTKIPCLSMPRLALCREPLGACDGLPCGPVKPRGVSRAGGRRCAGRSGSMRRRGNGGGAALVVPDWFDLTRV